MLVIWAFVLLVCECTESCSACGVCGGFHITALCTEMTFSESFLKSYSLRKSADIYFKIDSDCCVWLCIRNNHFSPCGTAKLWCDFEGEVCFLVSRFQSQEDKQTNKKWDPFHKSSVGFTCSYLFPNIADSYITREGSEMTLCGLQDVKIQYLLE